MIKTLSFILLKQPSKIESVPRATAPAISLSLWLLSGAAGLYNLDSVSTSSAACMLSGRLPNGQPSLSHIQNSELSGTVLFFTLLFVDFLSHIAGLLDQQSRCLRLPPHLSTPHRLTVLNIRAHLIRERSSTEPSVHGWDSVERRRLVRRHGERVVQELAGVVDKRDVAHERVDVALNLRR